MISKDLAGMMVTVTRIGSNIEYATPRPNKCFSTNL